PSKRAPGERRPPGGEARTRHGVHRRVPVGVGAGLRVRIRNGRGFLARSGALKGLSQGHCRRGFGARVALSGGEGGGGQLADDAAYVILQWQYLRTLADGLVGVGDDRQLEVLSQECSRGDAELAGSLALRWLANFTDW